MKRFIPRFLFWGLIWSVVIMAIGTVGCGRGTGVAQYPDPDADTVVCGDGVRTGDEACDGDDFGGDTCQSLGWQSGVLACNADCTLDVADCSGGGPECGNEVVEYGEACDGDDLDDTGCEDLGYSGGMLFCAADCTFDTSSCTAAAVCGDGVVEGDERCDGADLGGQSCESLGFESGVLGCTPNCRFDVSDCEGASPNCGNGELDGGEQCDGDNLDGMSCVSLGFAGGTLACTEGCLFDTAGCVATECGNGVVEAGEQCDGADLDGEDCFSRGYGGGILSCNPDCTFDESQCTSGMCGNGVAELGEQCDAPDLRGETCVSLGFSGGDLACGPGCNYILDGCQGGCSATGGSLLCGDVVSDDTSSSPAAVDEIDTWSGPECAQWQMDGPEIIYSYFSVGTDQGIAVSLTGLNADLDLIVLEGQGGGCTAGLPCVDWSENGGNQDESVEFTALADVTYFIVVDGFAQNAGTFELSFQCVELEDCTDGVDNDGDGLVDCADINDCGGIPQCETQGVFELFPVNEPNHEWDLDSTTVTLTPDPNHPQGFVWSTQDGATDYPTQPGSGASSTTLTFTQKDETLEVPFVSNAMFPFYGQSYGTIWVNSHGSVSFGRGDIEFEESTTALFTGPPRVAGHWDHLNITQGGTVTVDEFNDRAVVTWDAVADNFYGGTHSFQVELYWNGTITITNLSHDGVDGLVGVCAGDGNHGPQEVDFFDSGSMDPTPGFYELFRPQQGDAFDLAGQLITFFPDAAAIEGYTFATTGSTVGFPFPPGTGGISSQELNFNGGDTYLEVALSNPNTVEFYGQSYDRLYVGTNGYVTFDGGDNSWSPSPDDHFDQPRLSGLFYDWEPQNSGTVWVDEFNVGGVGYAVAITYLDVPHFYQPHPTVSFQISIRADGTVMFFYDDINTEGGLVGISSGQPGATPAETDFLP